MLNLEHRVLFINTSHCIAGAWEWKLRRCRRSYEKLWVKRTFCIYVMLLWSVKHKNRYDPKMKVEGTNLILTIKFRDQNGYFAFVLFLSSLPSLELFSFHYVFFWGAASLRSTVGWVPYDRSSDMYFFLFLVNFCHFLVKKDQKSLRQKLER